MSIDLPSFDQLPAIGDTGERSNWGVFGADDQLGTVNLLKAEQVKAAAGLVRTGKVINLSLPLDFDSGMYGDNRAVYEHKVTVNRGGRDDVLDNFALQGSSQWDGLRHVRFREFGYYGGRQDGDLEGDAIGMDHWARHGIVGRGILIDAPAYFEHIGNPIDPTKKRVIGGAEIEGFLAWKGLSLSPAGGDILLLRTGWLSWLKALPMEKRRELRHLLHPNEGGLEMPGLNPNQATAAWLWDHRIAAIAADNFAVEALQVTPEDGYQHRRLIAMLGMPIGEFWDLDTLAEDCAQDGVYEFMLTSAPLYIPQGVGSPPNAYAIK